MLIRLQSCLFISLALTSASSADDGSDSLRGLQHRYRHVDSVAIEARCEESTDGALITTLAVDSHGRFASQQFSQQQFADPDDWDVKPFQFVFFDGSVVRASRPPC